MDHTSKDALLRRDQEKLFHAEVLQFKQELIRKVLAGLSPSHLEFFQRLYGNYVELIPEESLATAYAQVIGCLGKQSVYYTQDAKDSPEVLPDPNVSERKAWIKYTNYRGETQERCVVPLELFYGETQWHKGEQWFVRAFCLRNQDVRCFPFAGIKEWQTYKPCP